MFVHRWPFYGDEGSDRRLRNRRGRPRCRRRSN
jgi:hypothetical protein